MKAESSRGEFEQDGLERGENAPCTGAPTSASASSVADPAQGSCPLTLLLCFESIGKVDTSLPGNPLGASAKAGAPGDLKSIAYLDFSESAPVKRFYER